MTMKFSKCFQQLSHSLEQLSSAFSSPSSAFNRKKSLAAGSHVNCFLKKWRAHTQMRLPGVEPINKHGRLVCCRCTTGASADSNRERCATTSELEEEKDKDRERNEIIIVYLRWPLWVVHQCRFEVVWILQYGGLWTCAVVCSQLIFCWKALKKQKITAFSQVATALMKFNKPH